MTKLQMELKDSIEMIPTLTEEERDIYGYHFESMIPLEKKGALRLYNLDILPVYLLYENNTEAMAESEDDILNHIGIFGIDYADVNHDVIKKEV